jgi:hypothetical protein
MIAPDVGSAMAILRVEERRTDAKSSRGNHPTRSNRHRFGFGRRRADERELAGDMHFFDAPVVTELDGVCTWACPSCHSR